MKNIFVVVPAFKEEKKIKQVARELLGLGYEVVVVDDGSVDQTWQEAQESGAWVLRHKINRGQGAALQTGTDFAIKKGAEVVVHFDGDGQFLASEIKEAIEPVIFGSVDVVLGSRFLKENKLPVLKQKIILPIARIINTFLTGIKLTDAHCGFRALSKRAAEKIKVLQDGMSHNTEIVAQIKKNNLSWQEVPITVIYHEFGQGVGGGFKILKELLVGRVVR